MITCTHPFKVPLTSMGMTHSKYAEEPVNLLGFFFKTKFHSKRGYAYSELIIGKNNNDYNGCQKTKTVINYVI